MRKLSKAASAGFTLSIDGVEIASFSELQGISTKATAKSEPRKLLAHELTHVAQKTVGAGAVSLTVKTTDLGQIAAQKLRGGSGRMLTVTATNARGGDIASYSGKLLPPDRSATSETVTIVCEHLQRVAL
ncbi:eCIS core domain-containing protein [Litoreibacter janthinus]|uniref:eCIS core domain-containing protein n=1 Tax=Litoreibacter janthinus TaxID=670154 RepID=A0A1I6HE45_9RHOB|nr:DUF4157 domain-containing protein [Litoreibacter janthinus]SFR52775.1 protein of unknown function [Litoreibacter janthinus]